MVDVTFIHPDGRRETHPIQAGYTVMDAALDNGVAGIEAQCGGGCTCSTCHCYVEPNWFTRLPPPIQDELDLLEYVYERAPNSRLSLSLIHI